MKTKLMIPNYFLLLFILGCSYLEPDEKVIGDNVKITSTVTRNLGNIRANDTVSGIIVIPFNFDSIKTKIKYINYKIDDHYFEPSLSNPFNRILNINTAEYKDGKKIISAEIYFNKPEYGLGNLDPGKHNSVNLPLMFSNSIPSSFLNNNYEWIGNHPKISWQKPTTIMFSYYEVSRWDYILNKSLTDKINNIDSTQFIDTKFEKLYSPFITSYSVKAVNKIGYSESNQIYLSFGKFIDVQSDVKFIKPFTGGKVVAYSSLNWGYIIAIDENSNAILKSSQSFLNIVNSYWTVFTSISLNASGDKVNLLAYSEYGNSIWYTADISNMEFSLKHSFSDYTGSIESLTDNREIVSKSSKWEVIKNSDASVLGYLNYPSGDNSVKSMREIGKVSSNNFIYARISQSSTINFYKISVDDQNNINVYQEKQFTVTGDINSAKYFKFSLDADYLAVSFGNRVIVFDSNTLEFLFEVNSNTALGNFNSVSVSDVQIVSNFLFVGVNKYPFENKYGEYFVEKWEMNSKQLLETYRFLKPVSTISINGKNSKIYIGSDNQNLIIEN